MKYWHHYSPKQRIIALSILLIVSIILLGLWSRANFLALEDSDESTVPQYALNFIIKEKVNNRTLPASGFVVVKSGCHNPKQLAAIRLFLAQGRTYCTVKAGNNDAMSIDSVTFTSTRQNKLFRLPLSGEKSLSKFWVSESLTIEATVNSDGTVSLNTKPTRVIRFR